MIIKPNLGIRIFWAVAGITLVIMACFGVSIVPVGLIFTCIGGPLAICAFGYAFGVAQTRLDDEGVFQRNFFFMTKKILWDEIESAKIESEDYNYTDSSGWTSRRTRTYISFASKDKKIHINANSSGAENWWNDMRSMVKDKLGERFR